MTIRLDERDYAALKGEAAPAKEQGHWRRIVWMHPDVEHASQQFPPGILVRFHGEEWMWTRPHPTEAEADQCGRAQQLELVQLGLGHVLIYRRAEFFPDYSGGGA